MPKQTKTMLLRTAFVAYCALMLWLLFGRAQFEVVDDYREAVLDNLNLVPFATVRRYLYVLQTPKLRHLLPQSIINLGGNIGMFIPLGLLLPAVFPSRRKLLSTLLTTACIITVIEIAQLFTLVGICDIDDLILNVIGAGIGYGIYKLLT